MILKNKNYQIEIKSKMFSCINYSRFHLIYGKVEYDHEKKAIVEVSSKKFHNERIFHDSRVNVETKYKTT